MNVLSFKFKNIFIPQQHGFRPGKSTTTNLCVFSESVVSSISRFRQVDCLYLDFAKAFDRVSHSHLIAKLKAYGIIGPLLLWLQSYLSGRTLQVKFASSLSKNVVSVTSGVPQGSLLVPLLFGLFINDIGESLVTNFLLFADDIKIFKEIISIHQQQELQEDLVKIEQWCDRNAMQLNADKCQVMSFGRSNTLLHFDYSLNGLILCRVTVVKDLGLYMTPSLDPGVHITKICAKANSLLGFIARTSRNALSPATLKTLYVTLVRPIVEYGSTVWAPHQIGHCDHLEKVQRHFLRLVGVRSGIRYPDVDIQEIANQHHILPLSSRRLALDLIFLFKIINCYINCPELLNRIDLHVPVGTRLLQPFSRHSHQTVYAYHSVIPRLLRSGNSAQQLDFFGDSLQKFRRQVFSWVAEHGGH